VAVDPSDNVYVVDQSNHRIQKFGEKTAPTVVQARPQDGATGVAVRTNVTATFSEKMDKTPLTRPNFKLYTVNANSTFTQITNATVTPSLDGLKAVLNPYGTSATLLAKNTNYKVVVTMGAKDLAANPLSANRVWNFTVRG
jgi:hypothetical protein